MSRVGNEIKRLRTEKGMTQKQLAKLAGVTEGFIDEVETGRKVMNDALYARIIKVMGREPSKTDMYVMEAEGAENEVVRKSPVKAPPKPVQEVWTDALGGVLKTLSVYDYKMDKALRTRQLPIIDNKVEGCPKEKVFYLQVEDSDMTGFRIFNGDVALACSTNEVDRDGFYFMEHGGKRVIRQIKRMEGNKLMLLSSRGSLATETVTAKGIKVLARLIRLEITL